MPTCLFCVKSSNNDQNPTGHRKYQKRSGLGWSRGQARAAERGWHLVSSNFSLPHSAGVGVGGLGIWCPATERGLRLTWLRCFCPRRRNAIFSAVLLLDSLVQLACGYLCRYLQKEQGCGGWAVLIFPELLFCAGGWEDCPPHTRPTACSTAEGPEVTRPASGSTGSFIPVSSMSEPVLLSSGWHIFRVQGI